MKNVKMKMLLFGLLLAISLGLKAQENVNGGYEYAEIYLTTVKQGSFDLIISVTFSNGEPEIIQTGLKGGGKASATEINDIVLKEVNKRLKDGWQVMNATLDSGDDPVYFLRRKK